MKIIKFSHSLQLSETFTLISKLLKKDAIRINIKIQLEFIHTLLVLLRKYNNLCNKETMYTYFFKYTI